VRIAWSMQTGGLLPGLIFLDMGAWKSAEEVPKGTKVVAREYHSHPRAGLAVVATAKPVARARSPIVLMLVGLVRRCSTRL
jgi:hypothetical protein